MAVDEFITFFAGIVIGIFHEASAEAFALLTVIDGYLAHLDGAVSHICQDQGGKQSITMEGSYMHIIPVLSQISTAEGQTKRYA